MPVKIIETDTNKIVEATNGLQFSIYFVTETVLFCIVLFILDCFIYFGILY